MKVFIDQLYSPKVSEARQEALKKRWQIKQKLPDWSVFLKYPARIFVRRPKDDHPDHIKDDKINTLYNVCAVPWGVLSTGGVQYRGGYHVYRGGIS